MTGFRHKVIDAGFKILETTRAHRLVAPLTRGRGAILTFHHVRPLDDEGFVPNRGLEITPSFLDSLLAHVRTSGYRIVPLDAVLSLLRSGDGEPPFVTLTFDDGYRDNIRYALPVLEKYDAPFTTFVTTGFLDRTAPLWWVELEALIRTRTEIDIEIDDRPRSFATRSLGEKERAFAAIAHAILKGRDGTRADRISALARRAGISGHAILDQSCMDWSELDTLARHPLATIGCHTRTHPRLAVLELAQAKIELASSRRIIADRIGRPVHHLCYPYGSPAAAAGREFALARELGFATGVTTRPGVLFSGHADYPTALPRLSVNGRWRSLAGFDVLLSGAGVTLWNAGRRLNVD